MSLTLAKPKIDLLLAAMQTLVDFEWEIKRS
jgi:hypothetical protein